MNFPQKLWLKLSINSRKRQYFIQVILVTIAYALGAIIAVRIRGVSPFASSVWPPAGIAQAALLLLGSKVWPGIVLGTLLFDWIDPTPTLLVLSIGGILGATLQTICAEIWLHRFNFRLSLERLIDVVKFIIFGVILACQISCTFGALSLCLAGFIKWEDFWQVRWEWFLGDAMGVLVFTPLILILLQNKDLPTFPKKQYKFLKVSVLEAIWFILLMTVSWLVFASRSNAVIAHYPLEYLPFPLIIWASIQLGQRGAILASFLVSSIAIWGGSQGGGPFIAKAENISQAILFLQAFMGVITMTGLLLAATVSERAAAEHSLRQSEIKYRELVENANSIILKINSEGNIIFFNEYAQKFFGYPEAEILGKSAVGTIIPPTDRAGNNLAFMYHQLLHHPEKFTRNEHENIRRSGERVWVSWANKPLIDAAGKLTGMLCIGNDITDRKRAEMALQNLNEQLELRVKERTNALQETLEALQYQQEQSEQLLLNILPEEIAARLKRGENTIADTFSDVTVLFADIVGFTEISSQISPSDLVHLLNQIFSAFDELADKHQLEKIKTVGDAYMVVGGLPIPRPDHAEAIANMALDMQQKITQFSVHNDQQFQIRIGINSGPVVAGVIGIKKFIYDLWGDTVNTASRMESHGLPGAIQVTETTYHLLRHHYILEPRGTISVKGKGEMMTYFLMGKMF